MIGLWGASGENNSSETIGTSKVVHVRIVVGDFLCGRLGRRQSER